MHPNVHLPYWHHAVTQTSRKVERFVVRRVAAAYDLPGGLPKPMALWALHWAPIGTQAWVVPARFRCSFIPPPEIPAWYNWACN